MDNKGLLFIPDISGFTRFVTEIEIDHSRLVIQNLLEILIDANKLGLEVSEVEGDAILFYKFGEPPTAAEIYQQVQEMFCAFHRHLLAYQHRRFCQCKACLSAINLSLKVITHYGEFTGYTVKNFYKLIGKDVIVAHQLLKNDIDKHEYWLATNAVIADTAGADFTSWMQWNKSAKQTETGEIVFHYTQLSPLKNKLAPTPLRFTEIENKIKMFSVSAEYSTDIKTLFYTSGHFDFRHNWMVGVKEVEQLDHFLPAVGMRLKYKTNDGERIVIASSFVYEPETHIAFSETDQDKKSAVYFILENLGPKKAKLTIDYYINKNVFQQIIFKMGRQAKLEKEFQQSLRNLETFVNETVVPLEF